MKSCLYQSQSTESNRDTANQRIQTPIRRLAFLGLAAAAVLSVVGIFGCGVGAGLPSGSLNFSAATVDFGQVAVGSQAVETIKLTNGGTTPVVVSEALFSGTGFKVVGTGPAGSLAAGGTETIQLQFAPSATGDTAGTFSIVSNAKNSPTKISMKGKGSKASVAGLSANPSAISFGSVLVGSSGKQAVTVTNSGTASENLTTVSASGTGFSVGGIALPVTLAAGQSASFTAQFAPTTTNSVTGSISIGATSSSSNPTITMALSGTGTQAQIAASPSSVNFGTVTTGNSNSQPIVISNAGSASVTISQFAVTGTAFSTTGLAAPLTIQAGGSATFNAVFKPTTTSSVAGSISLVSNAPNSPMSISLAGQGTAAGSASLSASPSPVSFGGIAVGSTGKQVVTVTNSGTASETVTAISATGTGFSVSGMTLPLTLDAGKSATFTEQFDRSDQQRFRSYDHGGSERDGNRGTDCSEPFERELWDGNDGKQQFTADRDLQCGKRELDDLSIGSDRDRLQHDGTDRSADDPGGTVCFFQRCFQTEFHIHGFRLDFAGEQRTQFSAVGFPGWKRRNGNVFAERFAVQSDIRQRCGGDEHVPERFADEHRQLQHYDFRGELEGSGFQRFGGQFGVDADAQPDCRSKRNL